MSFSKLGLNALLLKALKEQGYTEPTPIQKQAIPVILAKKDILAGAQTGTGKTAGFTLPLLQMLNEKKSTNQKTPIRALILTPTRELAAQVAQSVETYGKYLPLKSTVVFGGVGINPQKAILRKGVDILIATPGRLLDHVEQKTVDLSRVEFLILDEADRMLDMGFIHDIKRVLAIVPKHKQTLLFSATFSDEIKRLSDGLLNQPALIEVAARNTASQKVKQTVYSVSKERKKDLLIHLISEGNWRQVLVFTRTKHGANKLSEELARKGINSAAIHGNKSQGARTKALADFKKGSVRVLVATDIAARGIDIDQLPHVINFELPNVSEDYVHRIGRTGRAGNEGEAISLVCGEELEYLSGIERLIKKTIPRAELEGFTSKQVFVAAPKKAKSKPRNASENNRSNSDRNARTNSNRGFESKNKESRPQERERSSTFKKKESHSENRSDYRSTKPKGDASASTRRRVSASSQRSKREYS
ncbi:MAG: DEAD/DEAH box helicase [Candidatus Marinarcus sp.]|uniref:DEAD/DEAH box helicase n=1 Tax=Candidatus Marinarcus sp. TaxID=3100987 RepID=UPI003AFFCE46